MNANQKFTPKYWIGHDSLKEDVFLNTANKYLEVTARLMAIKFGDDWRDSDFLEVSLFEVKFVDV